MKVRGRLLFLIVMMIVCIIPVSASGVVPTRFNGVMKYTDIDSTRYSYTTNHAVYFPNSDPILINGIRVYGFHYGDLQENVTIKIWDDNLTTLYQDVIPYEKIPFKTAASRSEFITSFSWVTISIPEHRVTGNFYLVVFTGSHAFEDNKHGFSIGLTHPSESGTSHIVKSNPNRIEDPQIKLSYNTWEVGNIDWMIQVLYSLPVPTTTIEKTMKVTENPSIEETVQSVSSVQITSQTTDTIAAGTTPQLVASGQPVATKAGVERPIVTLAVLLALCLFRYSEKNH